jgi:hypothetical protein
MMDYAYNNKAHKKVIKLTRQLNWYKEEMFARFEPYKFEGRWNNQDVTNLLSENKKLK